MGNVDIHKNRYYHQPIAPVDRIQSSFSSVIMRKRKKIALFSDGILKNLRMEEFTSFIKKGEVFLKAFPGAKARQLSHHTIPPLEENTYDAAAIHVGKTICLAMIYLRYLQRYHRYWSKVQK